MASIEAIKRQGRVMYRGIPWDAANKKKGPTKVFEFESDARHYAKAWERDRDQVATAFGVATMRNRRRVLFVDYAEQCAARWDGTEATRRSRMTHARQWGERFAKHAVDEIERAHVNEALADMAHLAPGTRRNRISFLRRVFAEAMLDKLITDNPCHDVEKPRRVTLRGHVIPTEDNLATIIEHMPDWFEVAILLAHDSGLRVAEVAGLRWFRIDWQKRQVTVKDVMDKGKVVRPYPKGKEQRVVPLSQRTIAALRRAKLRQGAGDFDFVLQRPCGRTFSAGALTGFWSNNIRKVKGLTGQRPTFHDLRHACAHRLVRAGIDIRKLQAFMGHKSLATTQIYMPDVSPDDLSAALDSVPVPVAASVVAIAGT